MTFAHLIEQSQEIAKEEPIQCLECKGWIRRGEPYEKTIGRWVTGTTQVFCTCASCQLARTVLLESVVSIPTTPDAFTFGTLKYDLEQCRKNLKGQELSAVDDVLSSMQERREAVMKPSPLMIVR